MCVCVCINKKTFDPFSNFRRKKAHKLMTWQRHGPDVFFWILIGTFFPLKKINSRYFVTLEKESTGPVCHWKSSLSAEKWKNKFCLLGLNV